MSTTLPAGPPSFDPEVDALLAELTGLCMESARDLAARQKAASDDEAACRLAAALTKASRAVRQLVHLQARLRAGLSAPRRAGDPAADEAAAADAQDAARLSKVREVLAGGVAYADRLTPDFWTRLEAAVEAERAFPDRPVVESVLRIARRLGVREKISFGDWNDWQNLDRRRIGARRPARAPP